MDQPDPECGTVNMTNNLVSSNKLEKGVGERRDKEEERESLKDILDIYFTFVSYKLYAIFFQFLKRKQSVTKGNEWTSFGSWLKQATFKKILWGNQKFEHQLDIKL